MPNAAVLDSTVLVSGFLTKIGVSAQLLNQAVRGVFDLYLSDPLIEETRKVLLTRAHLRKRFIYSDQDVEEICALLQAFSHILTDLPAIRLSRDPNDDMVLATTVKAQAQFLVTRDKDLLSIGTHKGIEIVSLEDFITSLRHRRESSQ
jgi:hypothetical protein